MKDMSHREMIHAIEILFAAGMLMLTAFAIDISWILKDIRDAVRKQGG
jgi:hypothetical protein